MIGAGIGSLLARVVASKLGWSYPARDEGRNAS
jgi:hypothetical protein